MPTDFQITYIIVIVTFMLVALVFFVVFSIVQYQKAQGNHIDEISSLRTSFQKEMLTAQLAVQKKTLDNVSTELHDNIGQILSLAKLNLYQVQKEQPHDNVSQSIEHVDLAIAGIRNVSHLITDNESGKVSLRKLLQQEVEKINQTKAIKASLNWDVEIGDEIGPEKAFMAYRMVQEGINNTIKHAEAKNIVITVSDKGNKIALVLKDDGKGFKVSYKILRNNGLQNLQKRANVINAELTIDSKPNHGTKISIFILKDNSNAAA